MLIVFFRAVILYILIVISIRLMGKRQIGELQPSELVITLLLSNIATLPIEDMTIPMSMGIVPIFTLVCLDVILSHCSLKFRGLRKLICGSPKIVVTRGIIDQKQLKDLRFSADDLLESLRSMGIFDINEVQLAVVETTGKISVYQKAQFRPVNNGGMGRISDRPSTARCRQRKDNILRPWSYRQGRKVAHEKARRKGYAPERCLHLHR